MSNLVTDAPEAWLKLQRKVGNIEGFFLSAAEYTLLDDDIAAIDEAMDIATAGPAALVEAILTGPFAWGTNTSAAIDISLDVPGAAGVPDVDLATDDNTVTGVTLSAGGESYTKVPIVTFKTSVQTTALGTAVVVDGVVTDITITEAGSYLDSELPVTVTIEASNFAVVVDIIAGDQTPDVVLRLQHAIETADSRVICNSRGAPDSSTNISESSLVMVEQTGIDLTINSVLLS